MNQTMKAEILATCDDEPIYLAFIIGIINDYIDLKNNEQLKVLEIIEELSNEKLIVAGLPKGEHWVFITWKKTVKETIQTIKKEWDQLGREPSLWDIVWFDITPKGKEVLKELLKTVKFKDEE